MQGVISAIQVTYYPVGAQVMTLVLPLGFFIVVMTALYFVFTRPHTVPGRRPIRGARPIAPDRAEHALRLAAASVCRPRPRQAGGAAGRPGHPARRSAYGPGRDQYFLPGRPAAEAKAAKAKVTGAVLQATQDAATEGSEDQE